MGKARRPPLPGNEQIHLHPIFSAFLNGLPCDSGRLGDPVLLRRDAKIFLSEVKKGFTLAWKPATIWRSTSFDPPVCFAGQLWIKNVQKNL